MELIKIVLLGCILSFAIITILLFRFYNNGYGSLASKRPIKNVIIVTLLLFIISIILYYIYVIDDGLLSLFIDKLGNIDYFEIVVTLLIVSAISKIGTGFRKLFLNE
ncbi:hypothetical protein [Carboxylicivirga marina]|uniref:hypothetical protein n=1 Tax=Carboxylicivirga marina TaxID=2800988 RepID=UPI002594205E|nr:hypothetical protein [uncultured Carboxylicivirga sp.]